MLKIKPEDLKKLLLENNFVNAKKVEEAEKAALDQHSSLQDILIGRKLITDKDLVKIYGEYYRIPFIDLSEVEIPKQALDTLPEKVARRYQAVVFEASDKLVKLAMADPLDIQAVQFIEKEVGYQTELYIASQGDILTALDYYKEGLSSEISKVIKESEDEISIDSGMEQKISAQNVQEIVQEAPIARALNIVLEYAVKSRASDIHIEPRESLIQIRFRVDGVLEDTMTLPKQFLSALTTRIKILANLRIDEHRVPQDGRIKIKVGVKVISIRVSTLPIVDGEKVVMRLLDESTKAPTLEELGFSGIALENIKKALSKPHGMLLVTGPTGSGKSTTLYSAISLKNSIEVNISTVEDPIEYRIQGVNQTQVNTKTGMTFASGLRALLRQDPDIIMVGEIRDIETAEMAIHAALTGHVVLSTLHTNNAAGCLPRLLDMEIEPFLIASTVNAVIGQRLVRKLCSDCREAYEVDPVEIEELVKTFGINSKYVAKTPPKEVLNEASKASVKLDSQDSVVNQIAKNPEIIDGPTESGKDPSGPSIREGIFAKSEESKAKAEGDIALTLYRPKGCKACNNTGYNGRIGIYEVLDMTEEIGKLIVGRQTTDAIQRQAIADGMITMSQDGFVKALTGITTVEEVLRVTRE